MLSYTDAVIDIDSKDIFLTYAFILKLIGAIILLNDLTSM